MKSQIATLSGSQAAANALLADDVSVRVKLPQGWFAFGQVFEWSAERLYHRTTDMLFRDFDRYVPNLTRQDGSAVDRLLASRFAGGNRQALAATRPADGNSDAAPPTAQPPPA